MPKFCVYKAALCDPSMRRPCEDTALFFAPINRRLSCMKSWARTPAGVFDGFLTGFCVSGFVAFEEFFVSLPGTALVLPCWSST